VARNLARLLRLFSWLARLPQTGLVVPHQDAYLRVVDLSAGIRVVKWAFWIIF
jgi:hypothetical protein